MKPVPNETVEQQLRWRYAVKKFDPSRTIPPEDWAVLEQALVLSPSSYGLQPWKFFVITDPATRAKLPPLTWDQSQVEDGSHVVVFAIRKDLDALHVDKHVARTAEVRGVAPDTLTGYRKMILGSLVPPPAGFDVNVWATHQVYLALGTFMTAAALLGIDTCPMEGFQPEEYDRLLGLGALGYHAVVLAVAGYRAADDCNATLPKVRFPVEDVVVPIKAS